MSGGSRIIAFGSGSEDLTPEPQHTAVADEPELAVEESWTMGDDEPVRSPSRGPLMAAVAALLTIAVWTAFYLWANSGELVAGVSPQQAIALISGWSLPVLLVCTFWLIALRTSTREAARFNETARMLNDESARLEQRLATVNSELSLAREFIAAQSRDLEALGRMAVDRISQHAERLDGLIKSNGSQIDAIAAVSESALDNMERLRGNLPVIVSSAKDVTNNIGNAGRAAQGHLQELITGFNKLNEFGQASERQVAGLRTRVEETLGLYTQQLEQIEAGVTTRFAALEQHSGEFRNRLEGHEVEALAAIRSRAAALAEELEGTRRRLDEHEAESLGSLRTRLSALREESTMIGRSLRDGETNALSAWRNSLGRIDEDIRSALSRLEELDRQAMEAAKTRLDELTQDVGRLDQELAERGLRFDEALAERRAHAREGEDEMLGLLRQRFAAIDTEIALRRSDAADHDELALQSLRERLALLDGEITRRRVDAGAQEERELETLRSRLGRLDEEIARRYNEAADFEQRELQAVRTHLAQVDEEIGRRREQADAEEERRLAEFNSRLAQIDHEISQRRAAHEAQVEVLAIRTETIAGQLEAFSERMGEIVARGDEAGRTIAASLETLAARLSDSRTALAGTDEAIVALTDASVRLLELIQAGATHAREDLPRAIEAGEARLEAAQARVFMLRDVAQEAAEQGAALSRHVIASQDQLTSALVALDALHDGIGSKADAYGGQLAALRRSIDAMQVDSAALAEQSQGALRTAIEQLEDAARTAVSGIETGSAAAVAAVAQQIGDESAAALDRVVRVRAAEVAGELEQAATHAAGISREAAIQLRDQLAKVNELAGNLERRVAHARERAEEQVDNDFARRSALITEALNSNAIDIAKALDSDVSDTAWAAYLKGDRGIFTRRAVSLLDTGEARSVQQLYETDRDFREHVSRYIHDFEAMLRQLLSTRDGHALGVTVLSSDMGKLYVALAQAIERLRG